MESGEAETEVREGGREGREGGREVKVGVSCTKERTERRELMEC